MLISVGRFIRGFYFADIKLIPREKNSVFLEEITTINYVRMKSISLVLLIANILLITLDLAFLRGISPSKASEQAYQLHLFGFVYFSLFFCVFFFVFFRFKLMYKRLALYLFVYTTILWTQLISYNTYVIYGQVTSMIISLCLFASLFIMNRIDRFLLLAMLFVSFRIIFKAGFIPEVTWSGFVITIFSLFIMSYYISKFSFSNFVQQFMTRQIIINNAREIGRLNTGLEIKIKERTEELTRANAQIELEKLRVSFFTNLSHEIRTPINVILSAQQLLELKLKQTLDEETYHRMENSLMSIKQYSFRLMRLTSNLIDITRIDTGYFCLCPKDVDIVQVIEDIVLSVAAFIKSHDIAITFDTQIKERVMAIDVDKIERVMLNLLSNAVKFTPKKGHILVSLHEEEQDLILSVKDSGIGIPSDIMEDIFKPFVQVDKTLSRNREGTGLGLSIVQSIVELHGGKISVKSDLKTGSEFIVSLPIRVLNGKNAPVPYRPREKENLDLIRIEFSDIEG